MVCLQTLIALSVFAGVALAGKPRHAGLSHKHIRATKQDGFSPARERSVGGMSKRAAAAKRCASRSSTSLSLSSTSTSTSTANIGNIGNLQTTTSHSTPTTTTASYATTTTTKSSGGGGGGGGGLQGAPVIPANWPSLKASGPTWPHTAATASDPYLLVISEALDNSGVPAYNEVHNGDMTYYETGQVACGDFYTDDTWTAAVSHIMWENWPGSNLGADTDRGTICGPYVLGREIINQQGGYSPVKSSSEGSVIIGGDGLANCQSSVGLTGQCHIPLTATIHNPANGKSCVVKIVDKCEGCAADDIDVTPTVFAYLSDMSLGRVPVSWEFNKF